MKRSFYLFDNFLRAELVTDEDLAVFAQSSMGRLENEYAAKVTFLTPLFEAFHREKGSTETSLTDKKFKVSGADTVMESFQAAMRKAEGAVFYASGDRRSRIYQDFFPGRLTEYNEATKQSMAALTLRVKSMAIKHAATLPVGLNEELQAFAQAWDDSFTSQEDGKSDVSGSRVVTSKARRELELGLIKVIHEMGVLFPGDAKRTARYFDLALLNSRARPEAAAPATGA
jgi:hypothetical protein